MTPLSSSLGLRRRLNPRLGRLAFAESDLISLDNDLDIAVESALSKMRGVYAPLAVFLHVMKTIIDGMRPTVP